MLISSYALCQLIAGPILGRLSDHMGRKPLLIVSQIGTLIGFLILAYANQLWVVFLRVLSRTDGGESVAGAGLYRRCDGPENRAKSFGVIGIAFGIGFLVGPGISGFLSQYGYSYPILAAAFLSASSVVCTATLLPRVEPHASDGATDPGAKAERAGLESLWRILRAARLGPLLWQFFFFAFFFSLSVSGFAFLRSGGICGKTIRWARRSGLHLCLRGFPGDHPAGRSDWEAGEVVGRAEAGVDRLWRGLRRSAWMAWTFTIPQLLLNSTFGSYGSGVVRPAADVADHAESGEA